MVDAPVGRSAREPTRMAVSANGREARTRYEVERALARARACRCCAAGWRPAAPTRSGCTWRPSATPSSATPPTPAGAGAGVEVPRMFLHAARLAFDHPVTGEPLAFDSPLPDDLAAVLPR